MVAMPKPRQKTLRDWRLSFYMPQTEWAEFLGVDQSTISNWERGASTPKISIKAKIVAKMATKGVQAEQILWPEK
jgi:predicted transcriptional regulator